MTWARELLVNSPNKDWLISGSFGSFAVRRKRIARPVRHARSVVQVPFLFIKRGVWEFQEIELRERPFVQPGHGIDVLFA